MTAVPRSPVEDLDRRRAHGASSTAVDVLGPTVRVVGGAVDAMIALPPGHAPRRLESVVTDPHGIA